MLANSIQEARAAWSSPFQFQPSNNALGIEMEATTTSGTSSQTALVGSGNTIMVVNDGLVAASLALGPSSITATLSHMRIEPSTTQCFTLMDDATHAAVITRSGSTYIQITRGFGG